MPLKELQDALFRVEADAIVQELSTWSEPARKKAAGPVMEWLAEMDSAANVPPEILAAFEARLNAPETRADFPAFLETVPAAMQELARASSNLHTLQLALNLLLAQFPAEPPLGFHGWEGRLVVLELMATRSAEIRHAQELVQLGVGALKDVRNLGVSVLLRDQARVCQILLDRQPGWLEKWLQTGYHKNVEGIPLGIWHALFRAGLAVWDDENEMLAVHVAGKLPEFLAADPGAAEQLMTDVPEVRDLIYRVPQLDMFSMRERWAPIIVQRNEAGTLDRVRFLRSLMIGLHMNYKRNHRQDSISLALLAEPTADEWAEVQSDLTGLLNHSEPTVVGFALTQLNLVDRHGKLDRVFTLAVLGDAFNLKHKKHVLQAVTLLDHIAAQNDLRATAVSIATAGLFHAHADVREWTLQLLKKHLRGEDTETIHQLIRNESACAAAVLPKVKELLAAFTTEAAATDTTLEPELAPMELDFADFDRQLAAISESIRDVLSLAETLAAARQCRIDVRCHWPLMSGRVLGGVEAIRPIASLDELIDTIAAAVERLETPDEFERILDGLARLGDQKPNDFQKRTAALQNRIFSDDRPRGGLLVGQYLDVMLQMLGAWLIDDEQDPRRGGVTLGRPDTMMQVMDFVSQRVAAGTPCQLLSTPTHPGGWLDPRIWLERLRHIQGSGDDDNPADFVKSVQRLAPDGRAELVSTLDDLRQPYQDLAKCVMGAEIDVNRVDGQSARWAAAAQARDLILPATAPFAAGRIAPELVPYAWDWEEECSATLAKIGRGDHGFYKSPIAASTATQRPVSLEWYWLKAIEEMGRQLENRSSGIDLSAQFLGPLFERDRPLTYMSARALWIATLSLDPNARSPAIDAWIELISDGRADIEVLSGALPEFVSAGILKYNRVIEAFDEIARVSMLHTWTVAEILQRHLSALDSLPRTVAVVLATLHEWLAGLELPVSASLGEKLSASGGAKAKKLAKQLLAITDAPVVRHEALRQSLNVKFERAERFQ